MNLELTEDEVETLLRALMHQTWYDPDPSKLFALLSRLDPITAQEWEERLEDLKRREWVRQLWSHPADQVDDRQDDQDH